MSCMLILIKTQLPSNIESGHTIHFQKKSNTGVLIKKILD